MAKDKMTEEEIADVIGYYLKCKGWDLYPEVDIPVFGGRPDFVGVKNGTCLVVETKTTLSYPVLEQLTRWKHENESLEKTAKSYNNKKYLDKICIPHLLIAVTEDAKTNRSMPRLKEKIIKDYRLGFYTVQKLGNYYHHSGDIDENTHPTLICRGYKDCGDSSTFRYKGSSWRVREVINPRYQYGSRQTAYKIIQHLKEDMKGFSAGTTGKGYMTNFKRTMLKVQSVLERGGVWGIDSIIQVINKEMGGHHYSSDSSARSCISGLMEQLKYGTKVRGGYISYVEPENTQKPNPSIIIPTLDEILTDKKQENATDE